jgi:hypothetical protein
MTEKSGTRRAAQHGTAAKPAVRLTLPCGSPSPVVQRAVALVECPVFNPFPLGAGGNVRASRWANET